MPKNVGDLVFNGLQYFAQGALIFNSFSRQFIEAQPAPFTDFYQNPNAAALQFSDHMTSSPNSILAIGNQLNLGTQSAVMCEVDLLSGQPITCDEITAMEGLRFDDSTVEDDEVYFSGTAQVNGGSQGWVSVRRGDGSFEHAITPLPFDSVNVEFVDTACNANKCIAVGPYNFGTATACSDFSRINLTADNLILVESGSHIVSGITRYRNNNTVFVITESFENPNLVTNRNRPTFIVVDEDCQVLDVNSHDVIGAGGFNINSLVTTTASVEIDSDTLATGFWAANLPSQSHLGIIFTDFPHATATGGFFGSFPNNVPIISVTDMVSTNDNIYIFSGEATLNASPAGYVLALQIMPNNQTIASGLFFNGAPGLSLTVQPNNQLSITGSDGTGVTTYLTTLNYEVMTSSIVLTAADDCPVEPFEFAAQSFGAISSNTIASPLISDFNTAGILTPTTISSQSPLAITTSRQCGPATGTETSNDGNSNNNNSNVAGAAAGAIVAAVVFICACVVLVGGGFVVRREMTKDDEKEIKRILAEAGDQLDTLIRGDVINNQQLLYIVYQLMSEQTKLDRTNNLGVNLDSSAQRGNFGGVEEKGRVVNVTKKAGIFRHYQFGDFKAVKEVIGKASTKELIVDIYKESVQLDNYFRANRTLMYLFHNSNNQFVSYAYYDAEQKQSMLVNLQDLGADPLWDLPLQKYLSKVSPDLLEKRSDVKAKVLSYLCARSLQLQNIGDLDKALNEKAIFDKLVDRVGHDTPEKHHIIPMQAGKVDFKEGQVRTLLVSEFAPHGNAKQLLPKLANCSVDDKAAFVLDLLLSGYDAVEYLHRFKIYHSDLKLDNFVLDKNYELGVIDFGIAQGPDAESFIGPEAAKHGQRVAPYVHPDFYAKKGRDLDAEDYWQLALSATLTLLDQNFSQPFLPTRDMSSLKLVNSKKQELRESLADIKEKAGIQYGALLDTLIKVFGEDTPAREYGDLLKKCVACYTSGAFKNAEERESLYKRVQDTGVFNQQSAAIQGNLYEGRGRDLNQLKEKLQSAIKVEKSSPVEDTEVQINLGGDDLYFDRDAKNDTQAPTSSVGNNLYFDRNNEETISSQDHSNVSKNPNTIFGSVVQPSEKGQLYHNDSANDQHQSQSGEGVEYQNDNGPKGKYSSSSSSHGMYNN